MAAKKPAPLPRRPTSSSTGVFPTAALAANKSIIDFDQATQSILFIEVAHGGLKSVQHPLRAAPSDADHLRQPSGGNATFVRTHQIDGCKSYRRRLFGVLEDRAGGDRSSMVTLPALMQKMTQQNVSLIVVAAWVYKAIRPALTLELFQAGLRA